MLTLMARQSPLVPDRSLSVTLRRRDARPSVAISRRSVLLAFAASTPLAFAMPTSLVVLPAIAQVELPAFIDYIEGEEFSLPERICVDRRRSQ